MTSRELGRYAAGITIVRTVGVDDWIPWDSALHVEIIQPFPTPRLAAIIVGVARVPAILDALV